MSETRREHLRRLLESGEEISYEYMRYELAISDRILREDVQAISRTLRRKGQKLLVLPASCISCGFTFKLDRPKPGRCPQCKGERIEGARYRLQFGKK